MTESIERPEGAIPTPDDNPETEAPAPGETPMIDRGPEGDDYVVLDEDVDLTGAFEDALGSPEMDDPSTPEHAHMEGGNIVGEPLPVGAYEGGKPAYEPPPTTPGLPKPPDELDVLLATVHQFLVDSRGDVPDKVRPDQATVIQARDGAMHDIKPRGVRQSLLTEVARRADEEREAAAVWAEAVRHREEMRDVFLRARLQREQAEEAIFALGLDIEGDQETVEPTEEPEVESVIPDSAIV